MRKSRNRLRDRVLAWVLTLLLIIGTVGSHGSLAEAAGIDDKVTVGTSVTTRDNVALNDAKITFTAAGYEEVTATLGNEVVLVKDVTYTYEVTHVGYETVKNTFTPTDRNTQLKVELQVKTVSVIFKPTWNDGDGSDIHVAVTVDGALQTVSNNADGTYSVSLKDGTSYSVTVSGGIYGNKMINGTAKAETVTISLEAKTHTATIKVQDISNNNHELTSAAVKLTSGTETVIADNNNGTYTAAFKEGKTYIVSASCGGFNVNTESINASNTDVDLILNAQPVKTEIQAADTSIAYPDGTTTVSFANGYTQVNDHEISLVKSEDTNALSAEFTLKGIKETGTLKITASEGNLKNFVEKNFSVTEGLNSVAFKFEKADLKDGEDYLKGEIKYSVSFIGDHYNDEPSTKDGLKGAYYITKNFSAALNETGLVYGDDREIKIIPGENTINDDSQLSYSFVDEQGKETTQAIFEIHADGFVTIRNAGTASIKVTREKDSKNFWAAKSVIIENVSVIQKEIDPIKEVTYVQVNADSRVYNHSKEVDAEGKIAVQENENTDAGRLENADKDKIKLKAVVLLPSDDADTYIAPNDKVVFVSYALEAAGETAEEIQENEKVLKNYKLPGTIPTTPLENGSFTIKPAQLTVTIKNADNPDESPAVGIVNYQDMDNNQSVTPENLGIQVNGLVEDADKSQLEELEITPVQGFHDLGEYKEEIQVNLENKVKVNSRNKVNYEFAADGHQWAVLLVVQEQLNGNELNKIISYSGTNVYTEKRNQENDVVWVRSENGKLIINIEGDYSGRYDAVIRNGVDLHAHGILSDELAGLDKLKVQLAKKAGDTFINATSPVEIPFKLDEMAPTVTYQPDIVETITSVNDLFSAISFGTFKKAVYTAEFTVEDMASESGLSGEKGVGVNSVQAYVWKLEDADLSEAGTILADTIKRKIDNIENWNAKVSDLGDQKYSVKVANDDAGQAEVIEGSYIVLVKATDHVNNSKVYASNGIVVDITEPVIRVDFTGGKKDYYDGDVNYRITVEEGKGLGVSGVSKVEWTVLCNGKKVDANSGSESWDKAEQKAKYNKNELIKTFEKDLVIRVKDAHGNEVCNANDIKLVVTATDRSGHVVTEQEIPMIIDITKPVIDISYDNNDAANGKYFKNDRTATITFTERNFDTAGATFDLTLENGKKYTGVTLETMNNKVEGVTASWRTDSQTGKAIAEFTDARTNVATITFSGDNAYSSFVPHCVDKAGNENNGVHYADTTAAGTETEFVVDKTAPEIKVEYFVDGTSIDVGNAEAERIYKNKTINAVITVTEHNFALDGGFAENQVKYAVDYTKVGKNQTVPDYQDKANTLASWDTGSDIHQSDKFVYAADANYVAGFEYTDLAGNTEKWLDGGRQYFTVDKTPPEGTIEIVGHGVWSKFMNVITFNLFSKDTLTVRMTKSDVTSPTYEAQYCRSYAAMTYDEVKAWTQWQTGNSYSVAANEQFVPYLKVTDYAGNTEYFSSETYAVVDHQKPLDKDTGKPMITITAGEPAHGVYNTNVPFHISVEDPIAGNTYSGLASVKYEVLKNDAVTQTETFTYVAGNRESTKDYDKTAIAADNNSNNVKIRVTAVDNAGNETVEVKEIKIDITKPTIAITFNNNSPMNNKYYKDTRTATVVVTERNFGESAFRFTITNTDGTRPAISGWSHSANSGVSDAATHTCTVTFAADGDYTMSAVCTDLAGNTSESVNVSEFTIDKTQPKISVSYDNNSAQNGNYYKDSRTATITITEHNFRSSDVKVTTTASRGASAPSVSGWLSRGDRHTATVHFTADADYTFDINYSDLAGNASADYAQDKFTVDLTNPELEISGVKDKSANKGTVAPVITMSDTNYNAQDVTLTLTGANKGKINIDGMVSRAATANGQTITFRNFGKDMDDIYTLSAKVTDKAGNETTKSIIFSVNRNGSAYMISDATKKLIETGFTNSPQDIVIQEINVDTLEFIELTYSKDGQVVKLKAGTDYTVKEEGEDGQWKTYTYTIKAACFDAEGQYSINIYSEDRALNTTTNTVKEKGIEFVVDKTAPTVVVSNLEDRGRYKEDMHEFTLTVKDNTVLAYVEFYLDGRLVKTYEGDELTIEDGVIKINVDSKGEYQTVKLIAYDAAGNPTKPVEYSVLVTSSWWIQFVANKPLFFCVIAGIAVAAGFIIYKSHAPVK